MTDCPIVLDKTTPEARSAINRRDEIKLLKRTAGCAFYELGLKLNDATQANDHRYFGYDTKERYFEQEFGIPKSTAYLLIDIALSYGKFFNSQPELLDTDVSKLSKILPITRDIDDDEKIKEWLHKAQLLPAQALQDEINTVRGLPTTDTCEHPETICINTKTVQCKTCKLRLSHEKTIE